MLVIIVDHEHGFVGSRSINWELSLDDCKDQEATLDYLRREFPSTSFDDILFIKDDKLVEEWFGGIEEEKGVL